ncbi:hypothetical protein KQY30_12290 [Streptomyces sp. GMY02]|uniref:hypothetical protein n=1 Tax=Streptomyces sp. GMY02 TaxID=1333528 RepID=UPI001C2BC762|nr:hypothetical protein [Streptomyces sp. GMY02]QXE34936.1 hypothetical protein KQY30_12290 [Streptomyces sp. GMY02]
MISEPELEGEGTGEGPPKGVPGIPAPRDGGEAERTAHPGPAASGPAPGFRAPAASGPAASGQAPGFQAPAASGPVAGAYGPAAHDGPAAGSETIAGTSTRPLRLPTGRGPWLWALGGAVVASAIWAGGLYAYGGTGPDLGGYRVSSNLCLDAELPALTGLLGNRQSPMAAADEQLAIDRAYCALSLMPGRPNEVKNDSRPRAYAAVDIRYSLHKQTDPGPEFDATVTDLAPEGSLERRVLRIPDLGERAYLVTDPSGDSPQLKVLDGRAVISISVGRMAQYTADPATGEYQESAPLDFSGVESAMVEDMRDLMTALKR